MVKMTPNSKRIFDFLKANGPGIKFTAKEVQGALDIERTCTVVGTITGLAKKGFAAWTEEIRKIDGNDKKVKVFYLTPEGAAFDPDAE